MGYITNYSIQKIAGPDEDYEKLLDDIFNRAGVDFGPTGSAEAKWYDFEKDMEELTARYPSLLVEVSGTGEAPDDMWSSRYRNGESENVTARMPDFHRLALPLEKEEYVQKTYDSARRMLLEVIIDAVAEAPLNEIKTDIVLSDDGVHRRTITRLTEDCTGGNVIYDEQITELEHQTVCLASTGLADPVPGIKADPGLTADELYAVAKALTQKG